MHILLVDDDPQMVATLLRALGTALPFATFDAFLSGSEALVEAARTAFDIAILDGDMPNLDGAALGHRLRVLMPLLPLVYVTGDPDSAVVSRARALQPVAVFSKPWPLAELVAAIVRGCKR